MNNLERYLLSSVCDGDIKLSQGYARTILKSITTQKDEAFRNNMLRKLDIKSSLIELPMNLRELLIAEDVSNFPENRFVLRDDEKIAVDATISALKAAQQLSERGISYLPTLMLYGKSGSGKTMLARYIAHKVELPFLYVKFSNLVSSYLGSTQSNVSKIFDYAKTSPCVLCFDEIDAIGMARGQEGDVGEMNRVVISMMQEMDRLPNNVVIIGTTNRFDRLDEALVRRFTIAHEVLPMTREDIRRLAEKFLGYAGIATEGWINSWCESNFGENEPAADVIKKCTAMVVDEIIRNNMN